MRRSVKTQRETAQNQLARCSAAKGKTQDVRSRARTKRRQCVPCFSKTATNQYEPYLKLPGMSLSEPNQTMTELMLSVRSFSERVKIQGERNQVRTASSLVEHSSVVTRRIRNVHILKPTRTRRGETIREVRAKTRDVIMILATRKSQDERHPIRTVHFLNARRIVGTMTSLS